MKGDDYENEDDRFEYQDEAGEALGKFLVNYDEELNPSDLEDSGPEELVGQVKNQLEEAYDSAAQNAITGLPGWTSSGLISSNMAYESFNQGDEFTAAAEGITALGAFGLAAYCAYRAKNAGESKPE